MEQKHFLQELRRYKLFALLFGFFTACALAALVFVVIKQPNPLTVLIPPVMTGNYNLSSNQMDENYALDAGTHLAGVLLNVTPETVEWRQKEVLRWVHPVALQSLTDKLKDENTRIKKQELSSTFSTRSSHFYITDNGPTTQVDGILTRWVASRLFAQEPIRVHITWNRDGRGAVLVNDITWETIEDKI